MTGLVVVTIELLGRCEKNLRSDELRASRNGFLEPRPGSRRVSGMQERKPCICEPQCALCIQWAKLKCDLDVRHSAVRLADAGIVELHLPGGG
jgi:hypothetical protein